MHKELRRQDITFETKDQPLRDDVRILGTLVGDLLKDQGGDTLFEFVETARLRSIRRREKNELPGEGLAERWSASSKSLCRVGYSRFWRKANRR